MHKKKNYLFFGSDTGGERAAIMYSIIESCKLNHIDPQRYLQYVLERIAEHPINRIEELLPWKPSESTSHFGLACACLWLILVDIVISSCIWSVS
jgi:hypothetical protein